jgi:hypothetical protein
MLAAMRDGISHPLGGWKYLRVVLKVQNPGSSLVDLQAAKVERAGAERNNGAGSMPPQIEPGVASTKLSQEKVPVWRGR